MMKTLFAAALTAICSQAVSLGESYSYSFSSSTSSSSEDKGDGLGPRTTYDHSEQENEDGDKIGHREADEQIHKMDPFEDLFGMHAHTDINGIEDEINKMLSF